MKIKARIACQLSEGDPLYSRVCAKIANRMSMRTQPLSRKNATQRAISLRSKYPNPLINEKLPVADLELEPAVKRIGEYKKKERFEDLII